MERGRRPRRPVEALQEAPSLALAEGEGPIALDVQDADGAPLYLGVTLSGIQVGPSPDWMQQRLRTIGIEPKNNVVDITNYVLHDLGQPLHAFDADQIAGNIVKVRRATSGEAFTTLDGNALELDPADLVIADQNKPMCLAGVFGGAVSGVTDSTKRVFLESAWFEPVTVRKSAKRHTLSTDASFRFERGIDPLTPGPGLQLAVDLLKAHAGATVEGGVHGAEGRLPEPAEVQLKWHALDQWVGIALDRVRVQGILADLDIVVKAEDELGLHLEVPAYRRDVTRPADVVEEILRIHGYDHIPLPGRMKVSLSDRPNPDPERLGRNGPASSSDAAFTRPCTTPWSQRHTCPSWRMRRSSRIGGDPAQPVGARTRHPAPDPDPTRTGHGGPQSEPPESDLSLFEFGKVYRQDGEGGHQEDERLCLLVTGRTAPRAGVAFPKMDSLFLKGAVDAILTRSHLQHAKSSALEPGALFREGIALKAKGGFAARLGRVHPQWRATSVWTASRLLCRFARSRPAPEHWQGSNSSR